MPSACTFFLTDFVIAKGWRLLRHCAARNDGNLPCLALLKLLQYRVQHDAGRHGEELVDRQWLEQLFHQVEVPALVLGDRRPTGIRHAGEHDPAVIGVAHPLSVNIETFGTGKIPDDKIAELILEHFDLRPGAIIRDLDLRKPIYQKTAAYGHFGRDDIEFTWERTNKAAALKKAAGL